jgi:methyl-accepting chemotaxis protein
VNPSLSASAEDRRHDGVLCALVGLGAFLLIGGSWRGDHAVVGAVSALLGLGLALLLRWRLPGSLASRLGISLLAALMATAIEVWAPHVLSERASGAAMPVLLALLLPYRDWRVLVLAGGANAFARVLLGRADTTNILLLIALTAGLALLARRMEQEASERFELEFLVNAMGREGPIRLNLDAVRAESKVGARLKQVQLRMADALGLVRTATMGIHHVSKELGLGAVDLRERTEQTVRGLEDAAMSLDQINVIVQESARASGEARKLAGDASQLAERGGTVVKRLVTTMQDIDVSSRRITEIIGTIDGIAFQTNILALNAAVEAARAGEAGRGFAVVAAEVRMLAGRSSEAAREIKQLITASLETVARGTREAELAGSTMNEVVGSVVGVGRAFETLTADSAEHAASIDVVTASVKELDEVTTRNVAVAVRTSEIATELLQEAARLAEVLSSFRLGNDEQVAHLLEQTLAAADQSKKALADAIQLRDRSGNSSGGVDFF